MSMKKSDAIRLLGGTASVAAEAIGITPSAVSQWPEVLPARLEDRVLAALARRHLPPELLGQSDAEVKAHAGDGEAGVATATESAACQ